MQGKPTAVTANRTLLLASKHFVLERVELPEGSSWALLAEPETWMLILDGHAAIGLTAASIGEAIFIGGGRNSIEVGRNGLSALIAYPASRPIDCLLQSLSEQPGKLTHPATRSVPQFAGSAEART
jgi:mannose-6-phosphate isomerase